LPGVIGEVLAAENTEKKQLQIFLHVQAGGFDSCARVFREII
jgi:hypothetical protein